METLTHIRKLSNPHYIGSYELMSGDNPIELTVTIEKVVQEMVQNGDKKDECIVMYLNGHKPMIINSTNRKALQKATGTDFIERMIGKQVTLYVAKIKAFGETVDALRIRPNAPIAPQLPELNEAHPKWAGALKAMKAGNTTIDAIKKSYLITTENEAKLCTSSKLEPAEQVA